MFLMSITATMVVEMRTLLFLVAILTAAPSYAYTWRDAPHPHTTNVVTEMVEGEWRIVPYAKDGNRFILIQDNSIRRGLFKTEEDAKAEAERHQKLIDAGEEKRHP